MSGYETHYITIICLILIGPWRLGDGIALEPGPPRRSHRVTIYGGDWRLLLREFYGWEDGLENGSRWEHICVVHRGQRYSLLWNTVSRAQGNLETKILTRGRST